MQIIILGISLLSILLFYHFIYPIFNEKNTTNDEESHNK